MVENLARNFNAVINNALRSIRNPKEKKEQRVEKEVAFILNLNKNSIKNDLILANRWYRMPFKPHDLSS